MIGSQKMTTKPILLMSNHNHKSNSMSHPLKTKLPRHSTKDIMSKKAISPKKPKNRHNKQKNK